MNELNLDVLNPMELEGIPTVIKQNAMKEQKTYMPDKVLESFINKQFFSGEFAWMLEKENKPRTIRDVHKEAAFYHMAGQMLSVQMRNGNIRWDERFNCYLPRTTEAVNTTLDITNWPYIQLPLLRKIFFDNKFIDLISTIPVKARTGTYFYMDIEKPEDSDNSIFDKSTYDVTYTNYTERSDVNTLVFKLASDSFTTTERALRTEMTDMLIQDLDAEQGLNGFNEVMPFVAAELAKAESHYLLTTMLAASAGYSKRETFNMNGYTAEEATRTLDVKGYRQTILDKLDAVATQIKINTGQTPTWILTDAATWHKIKINFRDQFVNAMSNDAFSTTGAARPIPGDDNKSMTWVGTIDNHYDVYIDNSGHTGLADRILVGATSSNWLYQGMIYLPFILGWNPGRLRSYTKLFEQTEGILNRSGSKMVNAKFYGDLTLTTS